MLTLLAIDLELHGQGLWVGDGIGRHDPRTGWSERRKILGQGDANRRLHLQALNFPPADVIADRLARKCLARKAKGIVAMNIGASLLLALVGLALAATGRIDIWVTPFYQATAYVFVIANSLRLVRFGEDFAAAEEMRRTQDAMTVVKPVRAAQKL